MARIIIIFVLLARPGLGFPGFMNLNLGNLDAGELGGLFGGGNAGQQPQLDLAALLGNAPRGAGGSEPKQQPMQSEQPDGTVI